MRVVVSQSDGWFGEPRQMTQDELGQLIIKWSDEATRILFGFHNIEFWHPHPYLKGKERGTRINWGTDMSDILLRESLRRFRE